MRDGKPPRGAPSGRVRLGYFTRSVVAHVARNRGIFARHGLDVVESPCRSSAEQFGSLRAGELDLVVTSPDNVAAYRLNEENPLGGRIDVRILLAIDGGLGLSVLAVPEVRALQELRGRRIGVDIAVSGFAMALYAVLDTAGLRAGRDYTVVELGSTPRRREALLAGGCDATLLYAGHDVIAEASGCRRLARVTDHLHPYLGAVLASTGNWLEAHPYLAQHFVDAWRAATGVILESANGSYVEAAIDEVMGLPAGSAAGMRAVLASERDGLARKGAVELDALRTVLRVRADYGNTGALCELSDGGILASGLIERDLIDVRADWPMRTPAIAPVSRQAL